MFKRILSVFTILMLLCGVYFIIASAGNPAPMLIDEFGDNGVLTGNWSKSFYHSHEMMISNENPNYYNGDVWKAVAGSAESDASIIYRLSGDISFFRVSVHRKNSNVDETPVKYFVSSDNVSYEEVPSVIFSEDGITAVEQPIDKVSPLQRYLKIVIPISVKPNGTALSFTPAIGRVEIYNSDYNTAVSDTSFDDETTVFIDNFGDDDAPTGDWSNTFEHSKGMSLTSEDPPYHNGDKWKVQQGTAIPDAFITYKTDKPISYFKVIKHKKTMTSSTPNEVKYYVSSDNVKFTEIAVNENSIAGITVSQEPLAAIPGNQRFLKIVIVGEPVGTGSGWNPRIGNVEIYSGRPPEKTAEAEQQPSNGLSARDISAMDKLKNIHPRIYADAKRFDIIKQNIDKKENIYTQEWTKIKSRADSLAEKDAPEYIHKTDMLWQRDVGDNIALLSEAYKISGDKKYFNAALSWSKSAAGYATWGAVGNTMDLEFGHLSTGLGIFYDWCFDEISDGDRALLRDGIIKHTSISYIESMVSDTKNKVGLLGNHAWNTCVGLMTSGAAISDEYPSAKNWVAYAADIMETTISVLADDGATFEGYNYGTYAMFCMSRYLDLSKRLLGLDHFNDTEWFKNNADYYLYLNLPFNSSIGGNNAVDFADSWRGPSIGPAFFLWQYAKEQRNGRAQWLANELVARNINVFHYLGILWYDETVPLQSPENLSTIKHFDDQEIVIARTNWSGDEAMLAFKSGPYMGHKVMKANTSNPFHDWGSWHVHPDAGQISLYGNGEWLLRDDGYTKKTSLNHSTLVINGQGQMGASNNPSDPNDLGFVSSKLHELQSEPSIIKVETSDALDYIAGDAAPAYDASLGLKKFNRHLLFIKPNVLIVVDDIQMNKAADLQLRFFPEQQTSSKMSDGSYFLTGLKSNLRMTPLTQNGVLFKTDFQTISQQAGLNIGAQQQRYFISAEKSKATSWVNATAFSWSSNSVIPIEVSMNNSGGVYSFNVGGNVVSLNLAQKTAKVTQTSGITVKSDGKTLEFDVNPIMLNGRVLVPYRKIFEAYGATVDWDGASQTVTGKKDDIDVKLTVGSSEAFVNGKSVKLDAAPIIEDGRVLVPVRFIAESLGAYVRWDSTANMVLIYSSDYDAPGADASRLIKLVVAGKEIPDFSPDKQSYNIIKTWDGDVPTVSAMPENIRAGINISSSNTIPGTVNIEVISENGRKTTAYKLNVMPYTGVGELEIFEITASDAPQPENPPTSAMDGNLNTRWSADGTQWIQFDLGEVKKVSGISLATYSGDKRESVLDILTSTDGETWQTMFSGNTSGKTVEPEMFKFPNIISARYVRLLGKGNSQGTWNSYSEVGIFGDNEGALLR